MSTCISRHGEYSIHAVSDNWYCSRCGVFDVDGVLAALAYTEKRMAEIQAERDDYAVCSRSNSRSSRAMFEVIGDVPEVRAARAKLDADPYSQDGTDFGSVVSAYVTRLRAELDDAEDRLIGMVPKNWHGLMEILDDIYPESVFPTVPDREDRGDGARIISLLRQLDRAQSGCT
jgi:hypothetical protein